MKRTKKLLALVLAMMMAFSIMAVTAAAHGDEDEGVMPLGLEVQCPNPNCRQSLIQETMTLEGPVVIFTCSTCGQNHTVPSIAVYVRSVCTRDCSHKRFCDIMKKWSYKKSNMNK